jgi:hypothetical protein
LIPVLYQKGAAENQLRPGDKAVLRFMDGHDRAHDRGRDHSSRDPCASGGHLRPTIGGRATSSTPVLGAIGIVHFPPAGFASHTVELPGVPDGRLSRCVAGNPLIIGANAGITEPGFANAPPRKHSPDPIRMFSLEFAFRLHPPHDLIEILSNP